MDQAEEYIRELFSLYFSSTPGEESIQFFANALRDGSLSAAGARLQIEQLGRARAPPPASRVARPVSTAIPTVESHVLSVAYDEGPLPHVEVVPAPEIGKHVASNAAPTSGDGGEWKGLFEHASLPTQKPTSETVVDEEKDPAAVQEYVKELYRVYIGEVTDVAKYGWIVKSLMDGSYTLNQAEMAIKFSPEARERAQREKLRMENMKPQLEEYVQELYRVFLHRTASPEETTSCVDKVVVEGTSLDALEDYIKMLAFEEMPSVPDRL